MNIRLCFVLPALLALGGCATGYDSGPRAAASNTVTPVAAPQRVDAVSDALGQKIDNMVASRRTVPTNITR